MNDMPRGRPLAERIVAEIPRPDGPPVVLSLVRFTDGWSADLRLTFSSAAGRRSTQHGFSMPLDALPALAAAIADLQREGRRVGAA